jgi:DoxX-like family
MVATTSPATTSRVSLWASTLIGGMMVLFLIFDGVIKLLQLAPAIEATVALGYPAAVVLPLGIVELLCLAVYLFPRTAPLGAVLLTGYLGGAVATHLRNGSPLFSLVFPVIIGALLWLSLWLRDGRTRALLAARG